MRVTDELLLDLELGWHFQRDPGDLRGFLAVVRGAAVEGPIADNPRRLGYATAYLDSMVGAVDRQEAHGMAASIAQVAFVASLEQPLPFTQEPDAAAAATMVNGLISLCLLPTIKMENAP